MRHLKYLLYRSACKHVCALNHRRNNITGSLLAMPTKCLPIAVGVGAAPTAKTFFGFM
jgi:hypothetical protein